MLDQLLASTLASLREEVRQLDVAGGGSDGSKLHTVEAQALSHGSSVAQSEALRFFPGSVAFFGEMSDAQYSHMPCRVNRFVPHKQRWAVTVLERRTEASLYEPQKAYLYLVDGRGQRMTDALGVTTELASAERSVPSTNYTVTRVTPDGKLAKGVFVAYHIALVYFPERRHAEAALPLLRDGLRAHRQRTPRMPLSPGGRTFKAWRYSAGISDRPYYYADDGGGRASGSTARWPTSSRTKSA